MPSAEGSLSGPVCGPGPAQGYPPAEVTCLVGQTLEIFMEARNHRVAA